MREGRFDLTALAMRALGGAAPVVCLAAAAAAWLKARSVEVFWPREPAPRGVMAFRDAGGVVSEIRPAASAP